MQVPCKPLLEEFSCNHMEFLSKRFSCNPWDCILSHKSPFRGISMQIHANSLYRVMHVSPGLCTTPMPASFQRVCMQPSCKPFLQRFSHSPHTSHFSEGFLHNLYATPFSEGFEYIPCSCLQFQPSLFS